ncbi:MAG: M6 family metalloprotease domain-containing protein, partial [bacterium]
MKRSGICVVVACLLLLALTPAMSEPESHSETPHLMPLNPDVIDAARARGETIEPSRTEARFVHKGGRDINAPGEVRDLKAQTVKAIVLLVEFTDNPPGGPTTRYAPAVFDSMLFGQTYLRGGLDTTTDRTLKNYYDEISYGDVDIVTLDLPGYVGWVTAPNSYSYYCEADGTHDNGFGPYPRNVQRLVMDAVSAADPYVDFSQYAVGGVVQNLFIVHAGSGAEWNGGPSLIWSHAWSIGWYDFYVDGVQIDSYSMEPECGGDTTGEGGSVTGPYLPTVGVYAHEFGHVLGLPDEYDYGYDSSGTGRFSLMAGGSWNRYPNESECAGNSPAHPSAWAVAELGFITPVEVTSCLIGASIPPIATTGVNSLYKLTNPNSGGQEYWLVENRQQIGFDEGLIRMGADAHGVVIYHVDENIMDGTSRPNEAECVSGGVYQGEDNCDCQSLPPNATNDEKWYGLAVEQADGLYQLELDESSGSWEDFYNSITGAATFDDTTVPNTTSYYDCSTTISVTNITGSTGTMTADFYGPASCQTSPLSLDFGTVAVGGYADDTFTITNTGGGTLTGSVTASCSHFSVISGGGGYSLNSGQSRVVTVRFEPTASGTHYCTVETGNDCCGDVDCVGVGEEAPTCSVVPGSLDFGTVTVGNYVDDTFTITNTGGGTLAGSVNEPCSHFAIVSGGGSYSLGAGQSVVVTVRFQPTVSGPHACSIETGTGECGDVSCDGVGEDPVACSVVPGSLDFGTVTVGNYVDDTFTITNTGGGTLAGSVSEPCSHYAIVSGGGAYSLGAGQSVVVTVRFQPTISGPHACSIETGTGECGDVSCDGVGEDPAACSVTPASLDFGTVTVGNYADDTFTITNTGGGTLAGSVSEPCSHFAIVSGGGSYSLGAGQSVVVTV